MSPRSILVIRLSAIGDIVMASGVVPLLRRAFPGSRIDWLVQPECRDLLEATSGLNQVLVWPRKRWTWLLRRLRLIALSREVQRFVGSLNDGRYDLVLDMQGLWKSAVWSLATRGRERVGLDSKEGSGRLMTRVVRSDRDSRELGSEYKTLLRDLGISPSGYALGLETSREDRAATQRLIRNRMGGGEYIVLSPFTTRAQKHWFEERWSELGKRISGRIGVQSVLIGGPGDKEAGERIEAGAQGSVVNLAGCTTLRQSLALIRTAKGLIGVDTGLTHMGVLSNIPTVALFGSTRPYLDTDNPRARVLYRDYPCSPCRRRPVCNGEFPCMQDHDVDTVLESFLSRLDA